MHNWLKSCFVLLSHDFSETKIDFPLLVSIDLLWNAQWIGLIVSALHVLQNLGEEFSCTSHYSWIDKKKKKEQTFSVFQFCTILEWTTRMKYNKESVLPGRSSAVVCPERSLKKMQTLKKYCLYACDSSYFNIIGSNKCTCCTFK